MSKEFTLIKTNKTFDVYETYDLLESPAIGSLKNVADHDIICVGNWCIYETTDQSGNTITCVSIQDTTTGEVFSGQSKTFRETFEAIISRIHSMETTPSEFYITVLHRTSKSGRDYIICALVSPDNALKRLGYIVDKPENIQ